MLNRIVNPALAFFLLLAAFVQAAQAQTTPQPLGTLVDAGGYRVHLYCMGTGAPTVVIVGGGFSFDWGLVQPEVARFTRVCTYDPSGTAWSDPVPNGDSEPDCSARVTELHRVLQHASIEGPFVLVGFSIGGLYARLYARTYSLEAAGMLIVDHAFIDPHPDSSSATAAPAKQRPANGALTVKEVDTPPTLIVQTPIQLGIEDDRNFERLPARDRDLHLWAMAQHPVRPTAQAAAECAAELKDINANETYPLGSIPLIVISTTNESAAYRDLQTKLLALSHSSQQLIADHSTHMVLVDAPEVIVHAIREVVTSVRKNE